MLICPWTPPGLGTVITIFFNIDQRLSFGASGPIQIAQPQKTVYQEGEINDWGRPALAFCKIISNSGCNFTGGPSDLQASVVKHISYIFVMIFRCFDFFFSFAIFYLFTLDQIFSFQTCGGVPGEDFDVLKLNLRSKTAKSFTQRPHMRKQHFAFHFVTLRSN